MTVADLAHRRTWKHIIAGNLEWTYREGCDNTRGENNGNSRLTDQKVREIRKLLATGRSQQVVADQYDVSKPMISKIARRVAWTHVLDEPVA